MGLYIKTIFSMSWFMIFNSLLMNIYNVLQYKDSTPFIKQERDLGLYFKHFIVHLILTVEILPADEQPVLPPPASGLKQAILTVKKGIVQAYCWRKRLRIVITPPQYLDYYFDQTKTKKGEGYMPRSALQKSLIEALSPRDKDLAEQLAAIK